MGLDCQKRTITGSDWIRCVKGRRNSADDLNWNPPRKVPMCVQKFPFLAQEERIMKPIRVLIADDHVLFREGVHAILKSVPDIEIVGEAGNGQDALTLASDLKPDVILMDIQMPDLNGVEATQRILKTQPGCGHYHCHHA